MRNIILYIACSIDGYIAKTDDDISFLSEVEKEGEDYGYNEFIQSVDTVLMGRKTYDKVLTLVPEFPHSNKETFIITRTPQPAKGNVLFYTGELASLIHDLKSRTGKNIFVDGGAKLVNELLRQDLIDEMVISYIPILLGSGIRLFQEGILESKWNLEYSMGFDSGLVQVKYKRA